MASTVTASHANLIVQELLPRAKAYLAEGERRLAEQEARVAEFDRRVFVRPVHAQHEDKFVGRCREPVRHVVGTGGLVLDVEVS